MQKTYTRFLVAGSALSSVIVATIATYGLKFVHNPLRGPYGNMGVGIDMLLGGAFFLLMGFVFTVMAILENERIRTLPLVAMLVVAAVYFLIVQSWI